MMFQAYSLSYHKHGRADELQRTPLEYNTGLGALGERDEGLITEARGTVVQGRINSTGVTRE